MDFIYSQLPEIVYDPADLTGISSNGTIDLKIDNNKRIIDAGVKGTLTIIDPNAKDKNGQQKTYSYNGSSDVLVRLPKADSLNIQSFQVTSENIDEIKQFVDCEIGDVGLKVSTTSDPNNFTYTILSILATIITVNGEIQNEWNADVKADKTDLQNYISKEGFNLENGEGTDSLVQKYSGTIDDTHYSNTNTGESAVVFGEANTNSGNRAVMNGKLNDNTGVNSSISGTINTNTGNNSLISGYKNINNAQNSTVGGRENKNYSEASAVIGSGNTNGVEANTSESYGSNIYGGGNVNTGKHASVGGSTNTNDGSSATVSGQNNNNTGGRAIVGGMGNTNSGHDTIVVGKGLKNSHENLTVFGKYNDNKAVNLLEIGNGADAEHPSNAFEVLKDGRAKVYGEPKDPEDVVRLQDLSQDDKMDEERVREIVAEETVDLQAKTDESLETESKEVVGAINELKGENEDISTEIAVINTVLEQSGLVSKYKATIEDTYSERVTADGANVLDGSKAILEKVVGSTVACKNLFNNLIVENPLTMTPVASAESMKAILDKGQMVVRGFNGTTFNNLNIVSAIIPIKNGASYICNGYSKQKISLLDENFSVVGEGNSDKVSATNNIGAKYAYIYVFNIAQGSSQQTWSFEEVISNFQFEEGTTATAYQPYFTGLKSASFGGIESTNADGTETATLAFPKTEMPLGKTIDFENKKITDYGVEIVLTGSETVSYYWYINEQTNGIFINGYPKSDKPFENYVDTEGAVKLASATSGKMWCGFGNGQFYWIGILDILGYTMAGNQPTTAEEKATVVANFKAYLAQRYADGNPVTIRYVSSTLQSETDFTADNEYIVYKGGTEKVLDNDGKNYGADNTLSQNYIIVTEVK